MAAFLGISVWISLATIVPGLITIATIGGALVVINPAVLDTLICDLKGLSEWSYAGLAITIMVMTQAVGILLEKVLITGRWLGPQEKEIDIPPGIDPLGEIQFHPPPLLRIPGALPAPCRTPGKRGYPGAPAAGPGSVFSDQQFPGFLRGGDRRLPCPASPQNRGPYRCWDYLRGAAHSLPLGQFPGGADQVRGDGQGPLGREASTDRRGKRQAG